MAASNFQKKKLVRKNIKAKNEYDDLLKQPIYSEELVHIKVCMDFNNFTSNLEEYFVQYANKNLVNKCLKEGYISNDNINVVSYSSGKIKEDKLIFDVIYKFKICNPHENMILYAKIDNITKIGIKASLSDDETLNPIVIFASRLHNSHIIMEEQDNNDSNSNPFKNIFKEGDIIKVKIIASRFEINDANLYLLGEIIKDSPRIVYN